MRETAPMKVPNVPLESVAASSAAKEVGKKYHVRVSPGGYASVLFFLTFVSGFIAHLNFSLIALALLVAAWTTVPALLWFDRIEFDGKSLSRTGLVAFLRRSLGHSRRLKITDIEAVETQSLRTLRSGGRVYYRYRCEVFGDGQNYAFASGGKKFRRMIKALLPLVAAEKLDVRSLELRDFLVEPEQLDRKVEELKLPSADVLENTLPKLRRSGWRNEAKQNLVQIEETLDNLQKKSFELRQVANELRIAGNLTQALEAFRRALLWQPENASLLHEFARGLHSYASAARSAIWTRRAVAALRLATERAKTDAVLLTRIGETHFQLGNFNYAAKAFRRALEIENDNFRAECGLAEIGLQDGKLAHVVHHYQAAARAAKDEATKNWARGEAEYFSLLSNDSDYMEAEVSRIGWASSAMRGKRICLRLTFVGLFVILAGALIGEPIFSIGWAMSAASSLIWIGLAAVEKVLSERFPPIENEDEE